jgi:hypothetical protein
VVSDKRAEANRRNTLFAGRLSNDGIADFAPAPARACLRALAAWLAATNGPGRSRMDRTDPPGVEAPEE